MSLVLIKPGKKQKRDRVTANVSIAINEWRVGPLVNRGENRRKFSAAKENWTREMAAVIVFLERITAEMKC